MDQEDQDIASAFAEFAAVEDSAPGEKPVVAATAVPVEPAAPVVVVAPVAPVAPAADPTTVAAAPVVDSAVAAAAPVADPAAAPVADPAAAPIADPAAASVIAIPAENAEYAALRAEFEALKAAQPKVEPAPAAPLFSADETAALAKYQEDWPDIAKGEALLRRAEYRDLVGYIFQQVEQRYAPALDYMNSRSGHDQYSDITALVPDYDAVRDKAIAWVDTQPAWLKATLQKVTSDGSPEEVAGLIAMYKKETGYAVPVTPLIVAPAAKAAPVLPPAAKKAAVSLAAVKSGRSEQGTAEEDDFDSAFAKYAEAEDNRLAHK
jgi:hypothetical protein